MAPNKFEKHIKKQLEEREITPSANAWASLSGKLDATEPQSKKKGYLWYGVAASVIGLLFVSVLFFNSKDALTLSDIQVVVAVDEAIDVKLNTSIENVIGEDIEVIVENEKTQLSLDNDVKAMEKPPIPELRNDMATVDEIDTRSDSGVEKAFKPKEFEIQIINTKILAIVSLIDSLEQNNTVLTDAEVDNLLRNAQEEILRDKLFDQNGQVDAMALLTEVEDELDKSFRDQIFKSLKSGFLKVRTAVADRNN